MSPVLVVGSAAAGTAGSWSAYGTASDAAAAGVAAATGASMRRTCAAAEGAVTGASGRKAARTRSTEGRRRAEGAASHDGGRVGTTEAVAAGVGTQTDGRPHFRMSTDQGGGEAFSHGAALGEGECRGRWARWTCHRRSADEAEAGLHFRNGRAQRTGNRD